MTQLIHAAAIALLAIGGAAAAKPLSYALPDETAQLKPGRGPAFEAAMNNCMSCHSADYVSTQPGQRGAAFWEAEVVKMIKVYHAPIAEDDARLIADYLTQAY